MKNYDLNTWPQSKEGREFIEQLPASAQEACREKHMRTMKHHAKKLAAWKPRPPLPDEGIDYRAELESMDDREREAAAKLIEREVTPWIFVLPDDRIITRRAVPLEDLDGIEALDPRYGPHFDQARPRMAQGLSYAEACVSIALGNHRRDIGRDSRAEFPRTTTH